MCQLRPLHRIRFVFHLFMIFHLSHVSDALSRVAVVGGGASGVFAALAAASASLTSSNDASSARSKGHPRPTVTVFEVGAKMLKKVKISGGGRCNVLHDASKPLPDYLQGYPRGRQALTGLLTKRFGPTEARDWFERRGVRLKTEADGRMFPTTDSSQTVIDALLAEAREVSVDVQTRAKVEAVARDDGSDGGGSFQVTVKRLDVAATITESFDAVILATGSAQFGYRIAQSLGHTIVDPVPSLFTLSTAHDVREGGLLHNLSGLSVTRARLSFCSAPQSAPGAAVPRKTKKRPLLVQEGPLLITHHGLSGPAALRLSAYGARELAASRYQGSLKVHWAPTLGTADQIFEELWLTTQRHPRKAVRTVCPLTLPESEGSPASPSSSSASAIPKRLWAALAETAGFSETATWGAAPKKAVRQLALQVADCHLALTGKGTFKEEFVTAGGVDVKEIDMRTMQSKRCPGLFLCGELIDVDGVTGGFNFMNCWSTGFVAGESAAVYATCRKRGQVSEG